MGVKILGVGDVGGDAPGVEDEFQRRLRAFTQERQREAETKAFEEQRARISGAMAAPMVATEAARREAQASAMATTGAARSLGGTAGVQTAGLAALGAGAAQQYGYQEARQVQAAEEQRRALAQMQLADMLRQQEMSRLGLERGDYAQALASSRAVALPGVQSEAEAAAREAERQRRLQGAVVSGLTTLGAAGAEAYGAYKKQKEQELKDILGF